MNKVILLIPLALWAGVAVGAVKYKCDGKWVDYWPCEKDLADNRTAIQAMTNELSGSGSTSLTGNVEYQLQEYSNSIMNSTNGAVNFTSVKKTTEKPLRAYVVVFKTNMTALMSNPNASKDNSALFENQYKTELWQRTLCTPVLKSIMINNGLDLVSGDLQDESGETQSFALCN